MTSNTNNSSSDDILNLDDDVLTLNLGLDDDLYDDSYLELDLMASSGTNTLDSTEEEVLPEGDTNTLDGTDDNDYVLLEGGTNTVNTGLGDDFVDIIDGINTANLGNGNDFVYLDGGINTLELGAGNDYVDSSGGVTIVTAGSGEDIFVLNSGDASTEEGDTEEGDTDGGDDDNYIQIEDFTIGDDQFYLWDLTFTDISIEQNGNDTQIVHSDNLLAVLTSVDANTLSEDDFIQQENNGWWNRNGDEVIGTQSNNTLDGAALNDYVDGQGGNDLLNGNDGDDLLSGGDDNDTLNGNDGDDFLYGGNGNDILNGNDGKDYIWGGDGNDTINSGAGDDSIEEFAGNNIINAGDGHDSIDVYFGDNNVVDAGAGNDFVWVRGGVNEVTLGSGSDGISFKMSHCTLTESKNGDDGEDAVDDDHLIVTDFAPTEDLLEIVGLGIEYDDLTFEQDGSNTKILAGEDLLVVLQGVNTGELVEEDNFLANPFPSQAIKSYGALCRSDYTHEPRWEIDDLYEVLGSGNEEVATIEMAADPMIVEGVDIEPNSFM